MDFKAGTVNILSATISRLFPSYDISKVPLSIEPTEDSVNGDFTSSFALKNYKDIKNTLNSESMGMANPFTLAESISKAINLEKPDWLDHVCAAKPGFINFYIKKDTLIEDTLRKINQNELVYVDPKNKDTKVIVEHTSVNPNKSMHIGHLRNAVIGDTVVNIYKRLGYTVETHNYIDDTGVQVADSTNAILTLNKKQPEGQLFDDYCWDIYAEINALYADHPELLEKRKEISTALEKGEGSIYETSASVVDKIVKLHLELISRLNINYDLLVYESDIIKSKFWYKAFEELKSSDNFYLETEGKQAGCWVLKYKDEKVGNKIFVRADGTAVYTAKDTAYHMWKFGLLGQDFNYSDLVFNEGIVHRTNINGTVLNKFGNGDRIINIIDERQSYPQMMVKYALETLGYKAQYENYLHLAYGVVNISSNTASALGLNIESDKSSYAMSGRKGIGVKARDVLDLLINKISEEKMSERKDVSIATDIAVGAIKHYMLKYNPSSEIVFDYKTALELKGNTGPYLQYSYARAKKILNKAGEFSLKYSADIELNTHINRLITKMSLWGDIIADTKDSLVLSYIADYAYDLSSEFHSFYEHVNILKSEDNHKAFLLTIVKSYVTLLEDVLGVIGIKPLESM